MPKSLDLDMIRKMEGPRPERWIPILCDEIERLKAEFEIAIEARERREKELLEIIDNFADLVNKHAKNT